MVAHHLVDETPLIENGLIVGELQLHLCQHFDSVFEIMNASEHETLMEDCCIESVRALPGLPEVIDCFSYQFKLTFLIVYDFISLRLVRKAFSVIKLGGNLIQLYRGIVVRVRPVEPLWAHVQIHISPVEIVDWVVTVEVDGLAEIDKSLLHNVVVFLTVAGEVIEAEAEIIVVEGQVRRVGLVRGNFLSSDGLIKAVPGTFPILTVEQTQAPVVERGSFCRAALRRLFKHIHTFFGLLCPSEGNSQIEQRFMLYFLHTVQFLHLGSPFETPDRIVQALFVVFGAGHGRKSLAFVVQNICFENFFGIRETYTMFLREIIDVLFSSSIMIFSLLKLTQCMIAHAAVV